MLWKIAHSESIRIKLIAEMILNICVIYIIDKTYLQVKKGLYDICVHLRTCDMTIDDARYVAVKICKFYANFKRLNTNT